MVKKTKFLFFSLAIISGLNSCREDAVDLTETEQKEITRKIQKTDSILKIDSIQKNEFEIENDPIRNPKPPIK